MINSGYSGIRGTIRHNTLVTTGIFLLVAAVFALGGTRANAAPIYIDWASTSTGTGGGITANVSSTITSGAFVVGSSHIPSDAGFIAEYGLLIPTLRYGSGPTTTPGIINSTIQFTAALPTGSELLIFDVDFLQETMVLLASSGVPALLAQRETVSSATSVLPSYNTGTGSLAALGTTITSPQNDFEVSIFDVSGVTSLQLDYSNGGFNSGIFAAIALPGAATAVSAPSAMLLMLLGLGIAGFVRNGKANSPRRCKFA